MRISNAKIGARISAGFGLMVALILAMGVFALYQIVHLSALTEDLYDHPLTVSIAVREIQNDIRRLTEKLALLDEDLSPVEVNDLEGRMVESEQRVDKLFQLVSDRFLGDLTKVKVAEDAFNGWIPLRRDLLAALRSGRKEAAFGRPVVEARQQLANALDETRYLADFAKAKAEAFHVDAISKKERSLYVTLVLLAASVVAGFGVALLITRDIVGPLGLVIGRLRLIARGDLGEDLDLERGDEVGELAASFREMRRGIQEKISVTQAIARGELDREVRVYGEQDALGLALDAMSDALRGTAKENARNDWLKTGRNELSARLVGEDDSRTLAANVLGFLAPYLEAQIGSLYVPGPDGALVLAAGYAFSKRKDLADSFTPGQGLVGQAALEQDLISVTDIPADYIRINSSFGNAQPRNIVALPLRYENQVQGVLELGSFSEFDDTRLEFLRSAAEPIALALRTVENQTRLRELLDQTQAQSVRLQAQQEELRAANEELEQQASALRTSEEELRQQQEELQAANEELEKKNESLERQQAEITLKNMDLDNIRKGLEQKAGELERATRYKSEFLANMSHELRTPLNSLLLLARNLMDNGRGNLEADQVEYARVIHKSGNDLLQLINDILDLSKVEAGKMTVQFEDLTLDDLADDVAMDFRPLLAEKGLAFSLKVDQGLPGSIRTDRQRVVQILRNLMSNAVKFTEAGQVTLCFHRPEEGVSLHRSGLDPAACLAVSVQDTGVGVPADKHADIFEAFQQAEGGTARRYGGTGLGLTISRQLAQLLGGELQVQSEPGSGSTFTLYLPFALLAAEEAPAPAGAVAPAPAPQRPHAGPVPPRPAGFPADDRDALAPEDRVILLVEDDPAFIRILADLCREQGFKILAAASGEEGLELAGRYAPEAILLDLRLPGMDGWRVLELLKGNPDLRHIPVHVMSGREDGQEAQKRGAVGFLAKPADRESLMEALDRLGGILAKQFKDLLLVEDDDAMRTAMARLVADQDVQVHEARSGAEALAAIAAKDFDCMILDLGLADMNGFELLDRLAAERPGAVPPVIVYTGRDLSKEEEHRLRAHSESIIIKGVKSEERLIDETALFLHQMVRKLPARKRKVIVNLHDKDAALRGKSVLLVDDDMRNLYALSQVLQEKGIEVLKAEDGQKALDILEDREGVDLVLLDIMMPVMDGYETVRTIRARPRLAKLPVIALTAKAMREDREKCIAAGCSDYLAKPVDQDRLFSLLRVWLYG